MRKTAYLALVSLMLLVLFAPVSSENDLNMDMLRFQTIGDPDEQLIAMQSGAADVYHDLFWTSVVETLDADGFLVTQDPGFHMGFVAYNIRADQSYRRSDPEALAYWPLKDVAFRHALVHCYDQEAIIGEIYGYLVTPIQSLVPPAQARFVNPTAPKHPYNPGDPFASPAGEHSTCGILKEKGYSFVDADSSGTVTDADYWKTPVGTALPYMKIWTPLMEVAPTSYRHIEEFAADLGAIGLAATPANGYHGLINFGEDWNWYLAQVYDHFNFDGYMVFYSLARIPTHLYSLLHSPWGPCGSRRNPAGVSDSFLDPILDIIRFSLDIEEIAWAARLVQEVISTPDYPDADHFALAYMPLHSRNYFNAYNPDLRGVVRSPGYGSNNKWTDLNIHWEPGTEKIEDGRSVSVWILNSPLGNFNPLHTSAIYYPYQSEGKWEVLAQSYDGLIGINPYNHYDLSWLAEDWTITETVAGMNIDFTLRDDIVWHDGKPFTAHDVEFCLEFLRDYQVPRYADTWWSLIDVSVADATHLTIQANEAGIGLFYNYAGIAAMLPEHIWNRFGDPSDPVERQAVLDYDPTEPYNVAPSYTAGPTPTPTNVVGSGPFIFQFYDAVNHYCDLWRNEDYFKTAADIDVQLAQMFHEVGDANKDGVIDVLDQQTISFAYGYFVGEPNYNPAADIVQAPFVVDIKDLAMHGFNLGKQREYP